MTASSPPGDGAGGATVGVIGVGEIARALVVGACEDVGSPPAIALSPRNASVAAELAQRYPSVHTCADNQEVVDRSQVVLLAVRPDACGGVLRALRLDGGHTVVSLAAGVPLAALHDWSGGHPAIVRAIPLPVAASRRSTTVVHPRNDLVVGFFDRVGTTLCVDDETAFDAASAVTGTLAAHLEYLASISAWLADHGFARHQAESYVRSTFSGLATSLAGPSPDLGEIVAAHTTPGGINAQFRDSWFTPAVRRALQDALDGVYDRLHH